MSETLVERPFLTRAEAADYLGVNVQMVDDLRTQGLLPSVKLGRKLVRIPVEAVHNLFTSSSKEIVP